MPDVTHLVSDVAHFAANIAVATGTLTADQHLVVTVLASSDFHANAFSWTISDTATRTWTQRGSTATAGTGDRRAELRCYTAPIGATTTTTTVTADAFATGDGLYSISVGMIDSDPATITQIVAALGTASPSSVTFGAAPSSYQTLCSIVETDGTGPTFGTAPTDFTTVNTYTEGALGGVRWLDSSTNTGTAPSQPLSAGTVAFFGMVGIEWDPGFALEQEGFRFYADDGDEDGSTTLAAQDTGVTVALGTAVHYRALLNATGDPAAIGFVLRAQKNGAGGYTVVPVGPSTAPTIAHGAIGTVGVSASGGTTVAPSYPSGITADGSELVLVVGQKPGTANGGTVTTPSGWTLRDSLEEAGGYGATLGADTGNTNVFIYTKDSVGGTETGTLTVTLSDNGVTWAYIIRAEVTGGPYTISFDADDGADASAGNVSIVTTNGIDIAAGDLIYAGMVIPTDVTTPAQFSAEALAQTGTTFGTVTELAEPDSTTGNDIGGFLVTAPVSSGSGTGAVTLTATAGGTTTNVRGPGFVLRLRASSVTNELYVATSAQITAGGVDTTARLTAPAGKSTSDFVAGRLADDENPLDAVNITVDDYTEVGHVVNTQSPAVSGDFWDLRYYSGAAAVGTYTVTGRLTLGGGATVTPAAVAVVAAVPQPAVSIGVTPAVVAATTAVPTPAVSVGVAPAAVAATVTVPTPTVVAGATVAPAAVAVTTTIPTPTAATGATVAPAVVAAVVAVPTPTVVTGAVVAPAAVTAATTVPTPAVSVGASPASVASVVAVPTPTAGQGGGGDATATPSAVATVAAVPGPAVSVGAAPAGVAATATVPTPAVLTGATVAPAVVGVVGSVPQPAVSIGVTPSTVVTVAAVPAPTVFTGTGAAPATVATTTSVPQPAVSVGAAPAPVATVATVPTPTAGGGTLVAPAAVPVVASVPQAAVSVGVAPATIVVTTTIPTITGAGDNSADLHPITATLRDTGHTAQLRDTGHTAQVRDSGHTATVKEQH